MVPNEPTYTQSGKVTTTIQMSHNTFHPVRQESSNYQYLQNLYTVEKYHLEQGLLRHMNKNFIQQSL